MSFISGLVSFIKDILLTVWVGVVSFFFISCVVVVFFCAKYFYYYSTMERILGLF